MDIAYFIENAQKAYRSMENPQISEADFIADFIRADVAPVRHARWKTTETLLGRCCVCSVCGGCPTMEYRYCPYCGARMDGGKTNGD